MRNNHKRAEFLTGVKINVIVQFVELNQSLSDKRRSPSGYPLIYTFIIGRFLRAGLNGFDAILSSFWLVEKFGLYSKNEW